ncbi:MAG TPA: hypothetical protein VJ249_08775 [Candidatus Bathyarchaeia archaeon]|nr:hypothetical protein [Candidatus Bathyarchaeia archaeon]
MTCSKWKLITSEKKLASNIQEAVGQTLQSQQQLQNSTAMKGVDVTGNTLTTMSTQLQPLMRSNNGRRRLKGNDTFFF